MINLPVNYDELEWTERRAVREEYIRRQKGLCYHCKKPIYAFPPKDKEVTVELYPDGFFDNPIHLHHNHITGMTIGAVHAYCNAVLWEYHGE